MRDDNKKLLAASVDDGKLGSNILMHRIIAIDNEPEGVDHAEQ